MAPLTSPKLCLCNAEPADFSLAGFTEHMGRCIYGGLLADDNTDPALFDPQTGLRTDVLAALKDELRVSGSPTKRGPRAPRCGQS